MAVMASTVNIAGKVKVALGLFGMLLACSCSATVVRFPLGSSAVKSFAVSYLAATSFAATSFYL